MRGRARGVGLGLIALLLPLGACGAPSDEQARVIDPDEVPYRLLEQNERTSANGQIHAKASVPRLYWTDANGQLVARIPSRYCVASRTQVVEELLDQLSAGPLEQDRGAGLSSALPPERWARLDHLGGDQAVVEVTPDAALNGSRITLAAAQVVLSLTSIAGINRVELIHADDDLQVPLPGGELTSGPLSADAYQQTLARPARPRPTTEPEPSDVTCPAADTTPSPRR